MSQNRPRKPSQPSRRQESALPGVLSAIVVLLVLGLLAAILFNRSNSITANQQAATAAAAQATSAVIEQATAAAAQEMTTVAMPSAAPARYSALPPLAIDPAKGYSATITTPRGDIVIKLRPDLAPQTVNSFIFLAREGFYNGLTWHRVIPGFVAQGGDPDGTGMGGPGYSVPAEFTKAVLFDRPGLVAMARSSDVNSAGSQFFITLGPTPNLNETYTIFGEVTAGMDIVEGIPERDPDTATAPGEAIQTITISEAE